MKHLALIYLQSEVYKTAIDWARRLLELNSCDESAHRLVMEALTYSGQRSTALAQYETCRLTLQQELDIEPEPETQKLYEAIKNNLISKKDYQASGYVDQIFLKRLIKSSRPQNKLPSTNHR